VGERAAAAAVRSAGAAVGGLGLGATGAAAAPAVAAGLAGGGRHVLVVLGVVVLWRGNVCCGGASLSTRENYKK
jgi:hypothetical protein